MKIFIWMIIFNNIKNIIYPNDWKLNKEHVTDHFSKILNNIEADEKVIPKWLSKNLDNASKMFGGSNPGTNPYLGIYGKLNWRQFSYFESIFNSIIIIINSYYLMIPDHFFSDHDKFMNQLVIINKISDLHKIVILYEKRILDEINMLKLSIIQLEFEINNLIEFYNIQDKYVLFKMKYFLKNKIEFETYNLYKFIEPFQLNINNIKNNLMTIKTIVINFQKEIKNINKFISKDIDKTKSNLILRKFNMLILKKELIEKNINEVKSKIKNIKLLRKKVLSSIKLKDEMNKIFIIKLFIFIYYFIFI